MFDILNTLAVLTTGNQSETKKGGNLVTDKMARTSHPRFLFPPKRPVLVLLEIEKH